MGIAMLIIILAVLTVVAGIAGVAGFVVGQRRLDLPPSSPDDRRITAQADQIESLEEEIRRLKDQADFTERLLTERGESEGDRPADTR